MGKRGPAPKGKYAGKSQVLSTRIRPDTRAALVIAAKRSGQSLSQEIEDRLRRTFEDDDRAADRFGSVRNRRLFQMVGIAIQSACNPEHFEADWLDDPLAFEIAVRTVNNILSALRPSGPIPETLFEDTSPISGTAWARLVSMNNAAKTLKNVQEADVSLPLGVSGQQHLMNAIKAELGPVVDRPEIFEGTADDMRRRATELKVRERRKARSKKRK